MAPGYRGLDRKASHYKIASHEMQVMSDPRLADGPTRRLLEGPIAATLLRLAAPGVIMLVAQVAINVLEAYFVGRLGPDALAGISVTFPLVMLMQTISAGGMGGRGHPRRRRGPRHAVARADLRPRRTAAPGHHRRRPRRGGVLRARQPRLPGLPPRGSQPRAPGAGAAAGRAPRRDPQRRRAQPREQRPDEPDR